MNPAWQIAYDWLALRGAGAPADLVMGFGHFDPRIACHCCDLLAAGRVPRILFTGGRGAGTADIAGSEAGFFRDTARQYAPHLPDALFLLEPTSTNTAENVTRSIDLLASLPQPLRLGIEIRTVALVATPYRQRRVWLTCRKLLPGIDLVNLPPPSTFEEDAALFAGKGQHLPSLLPGEVERIVSYGELGYIERAQVPGEVLEACRMSGSTLSKDGRSFKR